MKENVNIEKLQKVHDFLNLKALQEKKDFSCSRPNSKQFQFSRKFFLRVPNQNPKFHSASLQTLLIESFA